MVAQVKVVSGALVAVLDVRATAPGRVYSRLDVAVDLSLSGHDPLDPRPERQAAGGRPSNSFEPSRRAPRAGGLVD